MHSYVPYAKRRPLWHAAAQGIGLDPSSVGWALLDRLLTDPSPGSGSEIWQALAVGKVCSFSSYLPYPPTNAIPLGLSHSSHRAVRRQDPHHPRVYQRPYRLDRCTCHPILFFFFFRIEWCILALARKSKYTANS